MEPIDGFAKLKTWKCDYLLQKLNMTLGRSVRNANVPGKKKFIPNIELGFSRTISHLHARLVYSPNLKSFELHVHGKNGVKIDGIHYPKESVLALTHATEVQLGDSYFIFLLPGQNAKPFQQPRLLNHKATMVIPKEKPIKPQVDTSQFEKPQLTYAQLIAQAIAAQPDKKANVTQVYEHVMNTHAFYKHTDSGWKSSIRHNLSGGASHKYFNRNDDGVKKTEYTINPEYEEELLSTTGKPSRKKKNDGKNEPAKKKKKVEVDDKEDRIVEEKSDKDD